MADSLHLRHPEAIHHLPPFVTAPGETDVLFVVMAIFVLMAVVGLGVFYGPHLTFIPSPCCIH